MAECIKKYIKSSIKYLIVFIVCVSALLGALVLTATIPREKIETNMRKSLKFFKEHDGIERVIPGRDYTYLHIYSDSLLFNIIYCIDTNNPLESVMWSKYYETMYADINNDYIFVVENEEEPNQEYLRYWHGGMTIIRPLLVFFNIDEIYLINKIVMWALAIALLILLAIKSKKLALTYILAMVFIAFPVVPYCLASSWVFHIMFITGIIALLIEKRGNKGLYMLFFITGILTCYMDFLTTEIITVLVPLTLVLCIRKKEKHLTTFKEEMIFLVKSCSIWGIGYIAMWLAKWGLASVILDIDAIGEYVKDRVFVRVNGLQGFLTYEQIYLGAIPINVHNLYPLNILSVEELQGAILIFAVIIILGLDWKNIKKHWFSALMLVIAVIPYARYMVLANHSYRHAFFTFRTQMSTIIALVAIIIDCLKYRLMFKEITFRKKKDK